MTAELKAAFMDLTLNLLTAYPPPDYNVVRMWNITYLWLAPKSLSYHTRKHEP